MKHHYNCKETHCSYLSLVSFANGDMSETSASTPQTPKVVLWNLYYWKGAGPMLYDW